MIRQEQMEKEKLQEKVYELYCNQNQITELQKKLKRLKKQTKIQEEDLQEEVEKLQEEQEEGEDEEKEATVSVDIDEYIVYYKEIKKKKHYNEKEMREYIEKNEEECKKDLYEIIQKLRRPQKKIIEKKMCIKQKEKNI